MARPLRIVSDTQVATSKIVIAGAKLFADGSNACNAVLYNEGSSSKTAAQKAAGLRAAATGTDDLSAPSEGLVFEKGLYVDITGTNAELFLWIK